MNKPGEANAAVKNDFFRVVMTQYVFDKNGLDSKKQIQSQRSQRPFSSGANDMAGRLRPEVIKVVNRATE